VSSPETAKPAAEAVDRLGQVISGRYLIKELLGEGGMGAVYLAEHTHMKKRVALKLLHPEMVDNAEVSARFEREALASAHIEHPNVAAATDFGKAEDGTFFLVLEYVEGTDLRDALADGPLSVQRSLRIVRQIALALERAHEAGIVHRDLKPENVMLVKKDDEPDFVKVLDFGIAKLLEGAASASEEIAKRNGGAVNQPLTRMGTILGTPEYMAPEQALGETVTPAADLYGVGVMMYEMLTGKHPFDPPDRMAMLSFHIVAPVPTMQDRVPDIDVPPVVEAVTRCLLEKDSKKRYANARALVEAIDAAAAASAIDMGLGVPAPVPSTPGSGRTAPPAPPSSAAGAGARDWAGNDAFAQTSIGLPATSPSAAGTDAAPSPAPLTDGGLLARLGRQPRPVLFALAAGLPLAFIVLVVVLVLAFRGTKPADPGKGTGGTTATEVKSKTAPADRVEAAVALGPEALETLVKEFPEDPSLRQKLALAYHAQGKTTEALRNVRALLTANPAAANEDEIVLLVTAAAAKPQGTDDDEAFALLEGPLGERGVDALVELSTRAAGREVRDARDVRVRATKSLARPEVRAHASQSAGILLDFKAATACAAKHDLLGRAKEQGDARLLPQLKQLKQGHGRGFFSRDPYPCMRKDGALDDAVTAIEARVPAK
jgi:serine/threonine-protein kinase